MRGIKPSLALATAGVIGLALAASGFVDRSGGLMASAANRFLASLDDETKARAVFPFESPERLNWHFIPRERKGLPFKAMNQASRQLAFGLIQTGLSHDGFLKATTIMSLEQNLLELEKGSGPVRDPENNFLTNIGEPMTSAALAGRGAPPLAQLRRRGRQDHLGHPGVLRPEPRLRTSALRKGLRNLADLGDRALRLPRRSTTGRRRSRSSRRRPRATSARPTSPSRRPTRPRGSPLAQLNDAQRPMLRALIESYASEMPSEVGQAWLDEIERAGVDNVKFAWAGATERHLPHHYKVQGPTFLVEFNNTQNGGDKVPANHIHSVWRNMLGDFGLPTGAK